MEVGLCVPTSISLKGVVILTTSDRMVIDGYKWLWMVIMVILDIDIMVILIIVLYIDGSND